MIVVEDLAVKNLIKNRHLLKAIQTCSINDLLSKIKYKAQLQGIEGETFLSLFKTMPQIWKTQKESDFKRQDF